MDMRNETNPRINKKSNWLLINFKEEEKTIYIFYPKEKWVRKPAKHTKRDKQQHENLNLKRKVLKSRWRKKVLVKNAFY